MSQIRVLRDPAASGAWNMAVDEVLLETAATTGLATLRFYEWETATLSLGYFQSASDRALHAASRACPLVRRASGGGAILHDRELTYSIAIPEQNVRSSRAARLYDAVHRSLLSALEEMGIQAHLCSELPALPDPRPEPFLCFQRRTSGDVILTGHKIAGSAQRRRKGAILQHGSVLLARSPAAPELPGIEDLVDRCLNAEEFIERFMLQLAGKLALAPLPGSLSTEELRHAAEGHKSRFGFLDFTYRR